MRPPLVERKLFGTDGVRGIANEYPMTAEVAVRLGQAIALHFRKHARSAAHRTRILIGKDTRLSGYMFESGLAAGITSMGADVQLVGPLPTPGISFLTTGMRADAGIVISASHNDYQDNGIKIFGRDGFKLPDDEEEDRFVLLGISAALRMLVVCHCYRERDAVIRIISARKANRTERKDYEQRWKK